MTSGLETGEELQRVLRRFYPDLTDDDTVTVLHFNLMLLGGSIISTGRDQPKAHQAFRGRNSMA